MFRRVKIAIAKWQGPVIPEVRHEPAQIVQDVPPLNLALLATMAGPDPWHHGSIHENLVQTSVVDTEARMRAWAAANALVEVARYDDEVVYDRIAEECDAERL